MTNEKLVPGRVWDAAITGAANALAKLGDECRKEFIEHREPQ